MEKLVVANWKMNKTCTQSRDFVRNLLTKIDKKVNNFVICPSATSIFAVFNELKGRGAVGAQNVYCEEKGAFTGENSALMIKDAGADYCLVGHSERRHIFNETNEETAKKAKILENYGIKCIFCVGETIEEHSKLKSVLINQLKVLKGFNLKNIIIAYEPVWAIGTGLVAKNEDIIKAHSFIKDYAKKNFGSNVKVLYGGSVKPENAQEILKLKEVDGVLVGGASLDCDKFVELIEQAK